MVFNNFNYFSAERLIEDDLCVINYLLSINKLRRKSETFRSK